MSGLAGYSVRQLRKMLACERQFAGFPACWYDREYAQAVAKEIRLRGAL